MSREFPVPVYLSGKDIVVASSYRRQRHFDQVKAVSRLFTELGQDVYPLQDATPVNIDSDFVFLGGIEEDMEKMKIERFFLEGIKKAKLMYVVATNGYVGHSTSTEIVYALAIGTPTLVSEPIISFGEEVTDEIRALIQKHHPSIAAITQVQEMGLGVLSFAKNDGNRPVLEPAEKKGVFTALLQLFRTLRD